MALHTPRQQYRRRRCDPVKRLRLRAATQGIYISLGLVLSLALLMPVTGSHAQSGRRQQSPTSKSSPPPAQARPRRAIDANPQQQTTPAPAVATETRVATDPAAIGPPPPLPSKPPATGAADAGAEEVDPAEVIKVNSNLVTVPASVIDDKGRAVTDLKLEDFELRVDGQPRPIGDLGRSETPVRMVMLFDNSDSLLAAREFEKQAAVRFFRHVMRPIDQAAVYSVSTDSSLAQPFTGDVRTLVRTIERFGKPEGATALLDGISMAAAYLRPYQGRKVIVIVSDGVDTTSNIDFDTTLQRALASDCQVYCVDTDIIENVNLTGQYENANLRDLTAERRMQELTAQTGGAVYVPKSTADLDKAFAQISADLAQQYVLSYYPTDDRRDGRFRTISLRVTTRPNLRVRARKGYYPPKT